MSDKGESIPSPIVCSESWHDTTVVVSCAGPVDMVTAPDLQHVISAALKKQPTAMIIDLTDTELLASYGMSVLLETHERLLPDVPLVVVADGPITRRPLELVGLASVLTIRPDLGAAFNELRGAQD
ncbi:STAS domain-containing protein [Mycolicibacterium bacteremicum]|uniref:STAS domain-containing protein n=1 Tax=Mycolicibacterium bacteremicum TaxID=564198 RepID=UPI0026EB6453|nr:STAS domain-containing protein [Mycolicibacterium bacteremicum]